MPETTTARRLPPLIDRYLARAAPDEAMPRQVRITQVGEMFRNPGGRPLRFTAVEHLAVHEVAFDWEARFSIASLPALKVVDGYRDGVGRLEVSIAGLPIQHRSDASIALGEAYRYLAELPWAPHAIAANRALEWRPIDDSRVGVSISIGAARPAVVFTFDADGDIVRASADRRPRDAAGGSVETPWGGEFSEYDTLGGVRIPTRAEVYWDLPEGRFVYWRARIVSAVTEQEAVRV